MQFDKPQANLLVRHVRLRSRQSPPSRANHGGRQGPGQLQAARHRRLAQEVDLHPFRFGRRVGRSRRDGHWHAPVYLAAAIAATIAANPVTPPKGRRPRTIAKRTVPEVG